MGPWYYNMGRYFTMFELGRFKSTDEAYANFRDLTEDLLAHEALRIAAKEDLSTTLIALLRDPAAAAEMGERARQVFASQAGATGRCVEALRVLLSSASIPERSS